MSESRAKISPDWQTASANARRFSDDFKRDAVRLGADTQGPEGDGRFSSPGMPKGGASLCAATADSWADRAS